MKSLVTIVTYRGEISHNEHVFAEALRKLYPEIFLIHEALRETGINALVIPKIIRSMAYVILSGGWGNVVVSFRQGEVIEIEGEGKIKVNLPAIAQESVNSTGNVEIKEK